MEQTATAIEVFLGNIWDFFSTIISWLNQLVAYVTQNPVFVILIFAMPICGFVVGLFRRLKNA